MTRRALHRYAVLGLVVLLVSTSLNTALAAGWLYPTHVATDPNWAPYRVDDRCNNPWEVRIFENEGYGSSRLKVCGGVSDLDGICAGNCDTFTVATLLNDKIDSLKVTDIEPGYKLCLYRDSGYGGTSWSTPTGSTIAIPDVGAYWGGAAHDSISSFRFRLAASGC